MSKTRYSKHGRLVTVFIRPDKYELFERGGKNIEFSHHPTDKMTMAIEVEKHRLHKNHQTRQWVIKLS